MSVSHRQALCVSMTPVSNNVVHDILKMLEKLDTAKTHIEHMHCAVSTDAASIKHHCIETLNDLDTEFCQLLSALINSPLNGKLFVIPPQLSESGAARHKSLEKQMLVERA